MTIDRRDFLRLGGELLLANEVGFGLNSLFPHLAYANPIANDPHMFLTIRVWGGMDCFVGLNPWTAARPDPKDLFLDDDNGFKVGVGGTQINLGPAALGLEKHVQNLSVINGVFMGATDVGHPAAQHYITTSKGSPNAPHFICELADVFRKRRNDKSETILFNADLKTFDLNELTRMPLQRLWQLAREQAGTAQGSRRPPKISEGSTSVNKAQDALHASQGRQAIFYSKFDEVARVSGENGKPAENVDSELVAAAAFASDQARFAQVDWSYLAALDSHQNFPAEHLKSQKVAWDRLAKLLDVMSVLTHHATGKALFPHHVTLAVVTEFGRLPYLNEALGKDHDFFDNSVLVGCKGVRGGQSIGAHHLFLRDRKRARSQVSGCHIDFKTGKVVKNGYYTTEKMDEGIHTIHETSEVSLIRPENLLRTLVDIFGVDPDLMRLINRSVKPIPGIIAQSF